VFGQNLEHRAGIEPAYTGFADLRVSHFATDAFEARTLKSKTYHGKAKPTTLYSGWVAWRFLFSESSPAHTPAQRGTLDSSDT
jgi:hypothetical protein